MDTVEAMALPLPLRPLDQLKPPAHLLGASGPNRAPPERLLIRADNDLEALKSFLAQFDSSPETHRKYGREAERLFLWSWHERDKPVSALMTDDYEAYLRFMADPQPAETWCGVKAPRETDRWRPFVGPVGESALMTAFAGLDSFLGYLANSGYLYGNPLGLIKQKRKQVRKQVSKTAAKRGERQLDEDAKIERFLDPEMWMAVSQAVESLPEDSERQLDEKERARFICAILYLLGPRAGELESMRMSSFREVRGHWWWHVLGKGDKFVKVAVPDDMLQALVRYRKHRKLSAVPTKKDDSPLLVSLKDGSSITARRLNQILKKLFSAAADLLPSESAHKKEKLLAASAHWVRHTAVTARVDAKMDLRIVQKDARHADARTTERYTHSQDEAWHEESQKVTLPWIASKA
ncbi:MULTISPECIES: tyrosine-type recombinase/integrase [unclassified Variovorax]|nr:MULTISPECIES: tyrosine-type recombinase/integrase [unclassified Variovorax]